MFKKEIIISIVTTFIMFILGYTIINNNSHYIKDQIDILSSEIVNSQSLVLERSIKTSTASAAILAKHISTVNGDMQGFDEYAFGLYNLFEGITNLQLAPDGIVTKIYPLEGHSKAIGHDIFKSDKRKKEAFIAKKSKKLTIAGPFKLIQGGVAIIARNPVYLNEQFWGFASSLVLLDDLLKTTDLHLLKEKKYLYRLWRYHPDTNKVDIFAGEKNLPQKNMLTKSITIPNGEWYLDIEYIGSSFSLTFMYILYIVNLFVSLLLGFLIYIILNKPKELEKEVNLKTKELSKLTNAVIYNNSAIFITNEEGMIEYINPAFTKITGYTLEDILETRKFLFQRLIRKVMKNKTKWVRRNTYEKKDKEKIILKVSISSIKDENNNINSYVGVIENITQKVKDDAIIKEKEILLLQQTKMATMGEMLGNIAHQWRQPLSAISVAASGLKLQNEMKILTDKDLIEYADGITSSAQYLSSTIDDFSNFFKPNKQKVECNTNLIITKVLNFLASQFKTAKIEIIKDIEDIDFITYENELLQVLMNILNNAKDQLIKTNIDNGLILIKVFKDKNKLFIKITDNAEGIKENIIDKIFEPYFTTKDKSKGTGIGLYMSQEIVVKHMKGTLTVNNKNFTYKDKNYYGAEFSIVLDV